jgi:hypothetical protein
MIKNFMQELKTQRWDDHRYYHHSRINQSLHLLSAVSFIVAYVTAFADPARSALIGWLVSMVSRQSGHFFFEPKGYDEVNRASHEYKEDIKVGYNLRRKVILHAIWALSPALLWLDPTVFGLFAPPTGAAEFVRRVGEIWLVVGVGALLFRTVHLFFLKDVQTGLVWLTDANVALTLTGTLEGYISQFSYAGPRFGFFLMSIFGSIGLILVTIGVYSLLAYTTARRTQEIGIRMALGAQGSDVLGMVIRVGLTLVGIGVGLGLLVSLALGKVIATQLWGVSAYDPWTLTCVPILLIITGLVACWVPARRASRVDPLVALRYE